MSVDKLPLPDATRWLVYDAVIQTLQSDPDLRRAIKPRAWHTYSGRPEESAKFGASNYPCIAVVPSGGPASPETVVSQMSPLVLQIDIGTPGLSVRNLYALWEAVERAAFAGQGRLNLIAALQKVCPRVTGVKLGQPAIRPEADGTNEGVMLASGTVQINLLV
jgi:hypothetical protein